MRIALFVEGSENRVVRGGLLIRAMWSRLAENLGVHEFASVIPISKKHLVAMDPEQPPMSGAGEALDQLMARRHRSEPFEAAVVAWDLVPAWNPQGGFCRWQETLDLYRHLAASAALDEPWRRAATRRHEELRRRPSPAHRVQAHRLAPCEVIAVCMEPMFEAMLLQREQHVLRALGLERRPLGWPTQGWGSITTRRPDQDVLAPVIGALRCGPRKQWPRVAKTIGADARNKDPWLEYLLRRLLDDPEARALVLAHPICRRLQECLARR
ncbi:hypothetical protein [Paraliomyxa miuraensis]|uniref:hypothetical protein n=1 Tax=Paraliomyxa miuraensis TaxID=376150 RepID=UPI00224DDCD0|nr:hypothetical protein [Paraliomyxa miuraensis]MCX4246221.1 hypothetical protein [Paraliomyxa miuraensis]